MLFFIIKDYDQSGLEISQGLQLDLGEFGFISCQGATIFDDANRTAKAKRNPSHRHTAAGIKIQANRSKESFPSGPRQNQTIEDTPGLVRGGH